MWDLADQQIETFVADGRCEFVGDFCGPFTMLVVADLLGVPAEDHDTFREHFGMKVEGGTVGSTAEGDDLGHSPLEFLYDQFIAYIEDAGPLPATTCCRAWPPPPSQDGSVPDPSDVAKIASNLFAAGQETTIRLLSTALLRIGEDPELQARLRADRDLVPNFVRSASATRARSRATSGWPARPRPSAAWTSRPAPP